MPKTKSIRIFTTIECLSCRSSESINKRSKGVSRYITSKNKRNTIEKLELKKHCHFCNKHTIHKEIK